MGVKNYLIEGVSCSGKTTVGEELERRGHHVVHGDRELAYWGDPETGEPLASKAFEHWIWDVDRIRALVADAAHEVSFFCGGSRNQARFVDLLDGVFVLEIDRATLDRRLALRPHTEWSGSPSEGASNARIQHAKEEAIPGKAIRIDATAPIDRVVDEILAHVDGPRRSPG
ncbi:MAG: nucleoside kinase [Myxococcota bacterium]|nr:nucleoside kinase [Myxococcota bacterium]